MEKGKSFEENIKELEAIVTSLESGSAALDDSINNYTKAMKIAKLCSDKLKNAEEQINKVLKENGSVEDFKLEE